MEKKEKITILIIIEIVLIICIIFAAITLTNNIGQINRNIDRINTVDPDDIPGVKVKITPKYIEETPRFGNYTDYNDYIIHTEDGHEYVMSWLDDDYKPLLNNTFYAWVSYSESELDKWGYYTTPGYYIDEFLDRDNKPIYIDYDNNVLRVGLVYGYAPNL